MVQLDGDMVSHNSWQGIISRAIKKSLKEGDDELSSWSKAVSQRPGTAQEHMEQYTSRQRGDHGLRRTELFVYLFSGVVVSTSLTTP